MMRSWRAVIVYSVAALLLGSCAGGNKLEKRRMECAERMEKAIELYNKGKYSSVVYRLEDARIQCHGHPVMDTVLYYLAMANLKDKKYIEAQTEFQRIDKDSPFYDEAMFRVGCAVFKQGRPTDRDQKETRDAIRLFDRYIEGFPHSAFLDSAKFYRREAYEKLALKEFNNAEFYIKAKEPESAVVYYKTFLNNFRDSKLVDQARYNVIVLLVRLNRTTEAVETYEMLAGESSNKQLVKAAAELTARYRKPAPKEKK